MEALTPRQAEILAHVANGKREREIAKILFISTRTVEKTLGNARRLFGARNNVQLLAMAVADEQLILSHDGDVRIPQAA
jgi:DNA-binding CsgD family transcriptional regulator